MSDDFFSVLSFCVAILEFTLTLAIIVWGHIFLHKNKAKWYAPLGYDISALVTIVALISCCDEIEFFPLVSGYCLLMAALSSFPCIRLATAKKIPVTSIFIPAIICPILFLFLLGVFGVQANGCSGIAVILYLFYSYPKSVVLSIFANLWLVYFTRINYFKLLLMGFIMPVIINSIFFTIIGFLTRH